MTNTSDSLEATVEDLKTLLKDAESVLASAGDDAGEKVTEIRERMREALASGQSMLDQILERGEVEVERADAYVRTHPWQTVGLAATLGVLAGIILFRRD